MPTIKLKITTTKLPLISAIEENTHRDLSKITPKQLAADFERLQPPSQIIINGNDQLCMMRELAKAFVNVPQLLLQEAMAHIKEQECNVSDDNLKLALLNISQAGISFIITKELNDTLFSSYRHKNQPTEGYLGLISSTPGCCVYV